MLEKMQEVLEEVKSNKQFLVRLGQNGLQFFGDDGSGGSEGGEGDQGGTDGGDGGSEGGNTGGEGGADGGQSGGSDDGTNNTKTFTQEDLNKLVARESRKAQEALFKKLGVKDFTSAKDALTKYNDMLDAQKTDAQKLADKATTLEQTNNDLSNQVNTLTAQLAGMKAGVNPDSLDDVIVLANKLVTDDVTMDDAIGQVLEKYPHFKLVADDNKQQKKEVKKPKFSEGDHKKDDKKSDDDVWAKAFSWTNS